MKTRTQPLTAMDVARSCHESMRAVSMVNGDDTMADFDGAPNWQTSVTVQVVLDILAARPGHYTPGMARIAWCCHMEELGWTAGKEFSVIDKVHPLLTPLVNLTPLQKAKDALLVNVVEALRPVTEAPDAD